ncbi:MAG: Ig-like domain-containing protein [Chloroflexota bacterium]|nr:Ig-like domain-containing protein [Chloroflexota bacterium]
MKRLALAILSALAATAIVAAPAAAAGPAPTRVRIAVPPSIKLGEEAGVQAQVLDASGAPVAGALVTFTAELGFLEATNDVVLADARTDKAGVASADIDLRTDGSIKVTARFAGDAEHAASSASAAIQVGGSSQLYAQGAGVKLPGFNEAPTAPGTSAALLPGAASLWPRFSGWPVALVLMIVWSIYGSVVIVLFRITASARRSAR